MGIRVLQKLIIGINENKTVIETSFKDQKEHQAILFKKLYKTIAILMTFNISLGIAIVIILFVGK